MLAAQQGCAARCCVASGIAAILSDAWRAAARSASCSAGSPTTRSRNVAAALQCQREQQLLQLLVRAQVALLCFPWRRRMRRGRTEGERGAGRQCSAAQSTEHRSSSQLVDSLTRQELTHRCSTHGAADGEPEPQHQQPGR